MAVSNPHIERYACSCKLRNLVRDGVGRSAIRYSFPLLRVISRKPLSPPRSAVSKDERRGTLSEPRLEFKLQLAPHVASQT
jgi:hypothetical protein